MPKKVVSHHEHHEKIRKALDQFNNDFLIKNNILFGGGTRIALELHEYRESVDIDFVCPNKESFKAVREESTNASLGQLVLEDFEYPRGILFSRDAVRTAINIDGTIIKLEFISFADYSLKKSDDEFFNVPYLDKESCYICKLLANADRYSEYKDIFDLLAMYCFWGDIPDNSWDVAFQHYPKDAIFYGLEKALLNKKNYLKKTMEYSVSPEFSKKMISEITPEFSEYVNREKKRFIA